MAAKKKETKKEVEVIEAEVVNEVATAPDSIVNIENYSELKENYAEISETVNTIRGLLNDTVKNYLKIGCLLSSISDEKLKELGCDSIYEFSKQNFNLGVTSTKNFINVYQKFGVCTLTYNLTPKYIPSYVELKEEFKDYSMSQLVELLPVADEDFDKFNPEMSCKEIRALKKQSQLTDFENEFYDKVKKSFLEIWNNVYPKINFETKNKIDDKEIIFDGNGNYSFNLPCLGKNIIIKVSCNIGFNAFDIYIETPRINYNNTYNTFKFHYDSQWDNSDDIVEFINNNCYKFMKSELNRKASRSSYDIVCEAIAKVAEKYEGKNIILAELDNEDFNNLVKKCEKNHNSSFPAVLRYLRNLSYVPSSTLFFSEFKLTRLDYYDVIFEKILFENSPDGNNPDYELKLRLNNRRINFVLKYNNCSDTFDLFNCFEKFNQENFSFIQNDFISIFDMFYYFAKKWAAYSYEKWKKEAEESDGDYDEEK